MEDWKQKAFLFDILGCLLYVIFAILAMVFYAGGTADNSNIQGYSFWGNTLSDSGMSVAHSGKNNTASMIFYSTALILWSLSIIAFFLALRTLFMNTLSTIGTIFAVIAAICLIGIGFTPADILIGPHMIFVYIGYTSLFIVGITYSITLCKSEKFPKQYAIIFIIWTIVFFVTLVMGIVGLAGARSTMVIGQKIGRFTNIFCFAYVGYGAWKLEKS